MPLLAQLPPRIIAEVEQALVSEGRGDLIPQLKACQVAQYTFDESVAAGYVYLVRPAPSPSFEGREDPVAKTIAFLDRGFNIDIDHDGFLFGIEFLGRTDFLNGAGQEVLAKWSRRAAPRLKPA